MALSNIFMGWLSANIIGILGIIVSGFIAYHVYFLSKRIGLKDQLVHKDDVKKRVEDILHKIRKGISGRVELVNVKKYQKHYPHSNDYDKDGHTYLGAELKALRFDGVEFFTGMPKEVYKKQNGDLSLNQDGGDVRESYNIFEVGVIPYEWIEYIDDRGDEFSYRPQFFVKFEGIRKFPYKHLTYYKESDTYHEGSDPMDFKWRRITIV